jgi:hypothetical protein
MSHMNAMWPTSFRRGGGAGKLDEGMSIVALKRHYTKKLRQHRWKRRSQ